MEFLNAPLLFGLVLATLPLVIHLLNRRRFELVEWAPMKYLKLTIRNNRRRLRIEQILLLILRTLLVVLLVMCIARPILSHTGLGRWLSHSSRVSRIVVLDDSLAMGYRQDGRTALDLGKAAAAEILHSTGAQDALTFLTTTPASAPLVREASLQDPSRLLAQIERLQETDAVCNWAATFKSIDDCLSTATFPQKEVILITDLRRSGWSGGVLDLANRWASQGVEARIIDVGSRNTVNVSLPKFVQEDPLVLPGSPAKLLATIHNATPAAIAGAQAVLSVDGETRPVMLPDLSAGATTDVPLSVTFDKPGQHTVKFSLPDDALSGDNSRFLSLNARQRLDLTLVDGRLGGGAFESAGDFLHLALAVGPTTWHVQTLGDSDPQADRPARADVTVLADAAVISPAAVAEYEALVRRGMGLIIFCGEQVDPKLYNERLYRGGAGLLPAQLDRIVEGPTRGLVVEGYGDSPLASLAKIAPAALARIQARRLMGLEMPAGPASQFVRVLARWNDAEGHPAVIEKQFGRGRVLLWTMSADREWSDWPVDPTYVLAVRSAAVACAWPDAGEDNLVAGHPLEYRLGDEKARANLRIATPDDPTPQPAAAPGGQFHYPHTQRAGLYTLSWDDASGKAQSHQLAASFDKAASDLEPLTENQLADLLGNLKANLVRYRPGFLSAAGPGREIWRTLASIVLGMMVGESLLAFWVGRER